MGESTSATITRHLKLRRNEKSKSAAIVPYVAIAVQFAAKNS